MQTTRVLKTRLEDYLSYHKEISGVKFIKCMDKIDILVKILHQSWVIRIYFHLKFNTMVLN